MPTDDDDHDLLLRLDERTETILKNMENFVTRAEFTPVRSLVFGAVGLILVAFMGALIYMSGINH